MLFIFTKNGGNYSFKKLVASNQLKDEHLFTEVMNFINLNLSGNIENTIGDGTSFLANAIKPVWNSTTMDNAIRLTSKENHPEYHKGYSYDIYTYYDFEPYHYTWPIIGMPDEDEKTYIRLLSNYKYKNRVDSQLENIMSWNYHHDTKNVSEWPWSDEGSLVAPNANENFHLKKSEDIDENGEISNTAGEDYCRLNMVNNTTQKGEELITFKYYQIWGYQPTWCNQFANDLSKNILFNVIPWGSSGYRASEIHDVIRNNNSKFELLDFNKAWEYANAGFIVYFTSYHASGVNYNEDGTIDYQQSSPGHIATGFPTKGNFNYLDGLLIQAGGFGHTKKIDFKSAWSNSYGENRNKVKAHVYLEYILKKD